MEGIDWIIEGVRAHLLKLAIYVFAVNHEIYQARPYYDWCTLFMWT